ncbi:kynurenine aminotransferase-like [Panonychus citri]|uniref:kynurenine aminotransferase-like n=1 Tax=Panonychus citri TaxID=50023 RepID=UPI002307DE63|nr:kynurenine aminotransferase-like [Panonychus citri]
MSSSDLVKRQSESPWVEYGELGTKYNSVNLCKGFPDFPPPDHVVEALITAARNQSSHQYTRQYGHPRLVNILSKMYSQLIGRPVDPLKEILITVGAYEALLSIFLGLINPGDEVIIVEPFYDCYPPMIEMAGGIPVYISLNPPEDSNQRTVSSSEWKLDYNQLASKFNERTKMIVVTTPNNPTGKVYSKEELLAIGKLCRQYGSIAVMDEVYEWVIYDDLSHIRMASLPEMWPYTLTVGSIGKTFSVTGWKIGWVYGPKKLINPLQIIHSNTVHTCATPIQEASAIALEIEFNRIGKPDSYWKQSAIELQAKRDLIIKYLQTSGVNPTIPQGGFFIVADYRNINWPSNDTIYSEKSPGDKFAKWLCIEKKLLTMPVSYFYSSSNRDKGKNSIRFCFFKKDSTIHDAGRILNKLQVKVKSNL